MRTHPSGVFKASSVGLKRPLAGLLIAGGVLLWACGGKSEPDPEVPDEVVTSEPTATKKKPPKPKCDQLSQNCLADANTQVKIAHSDLVFVPPVGWTFAAMSEVTQAQVEGTGPGLVISAFDPGKGDKEEAKARDAEYDRLVKLLDVSLPEKAKKKFTPAWTKPDATKGANDAIKVWQAEGAKRGGKAGFVVVVLTADPGGKKVLGVAFNSEGDEANATALLASLETIGPGGY